MTTVSSLQNAGSNCELSLTIWFGFFPPKTDPLCVVGAFWLTHHTVLSTNMLGPLPTCEVIQCGKDNWCLIFALERISEFRSLWLNPEESVKVFILFTVKCSSNFSYQFEFDSRYHNIQNVPIDDHLHFPIFSVLGLVVSAHKVQSPRTSNEQMILIPIVVLKIFISSAKYNERRMHHKF